MALMKEEPWEEIEQSYLGGVWDRSCHRRTVASLEAERTNFGSGKTTPRTWTQRLVHTCECEVLWIGILFYIVFMLFK